MADLHFDNLLTCKTNLPVDTLAPTVKMESTDPLSYYPTYPPVESSSMHDTSLDFLQPYDLNNQWTEQSHSWQSLLDNWTQPKQEEQPPNLDLLSVPSTSSPPTPPNHSPNTFYDLNFLASWLPSKDATPPSSSCYNNLDGGLFSSATTYAPLDNNPATVCNPSSPTFMTAHVAASLPITTTSSSSLPSPTGSLSSSSLCSTLLSLPPPMEQKQHRRRASEHPPSRTNKPYKRRASCHPSVASVVSLTAHEPISNYINGVEHITFLYSHERLVKEYTVRADVNSVDLDSIPESFKMRNTIYPRANVERSQYDGNRWEYETTCNSLGWKLCWLNKEQLCGRRGLIQRTVDSYRNRHAEMRSRRVTRQEKVANGTLRKRKSRKLDVPPLL